MNTVFCIRCYHTADRNYMRSELHFSFVQVVELHGCNGLRLDQGCIFAWKTFNNYTNFRKNKYILSMTFE